MDINNSIAEQLANDRPEIQVGTDDAQYFNLKHFISGYALGLEEEKSLTLEHVGDEKFVFVRSFGLNRDKLLRDFDTEMEQIDKVWLSKSAKNFKRDLEQFSTLMGQAQHMATEWVDGNMLALVGLWMGGHLAEKLGSNERFQFSISTWRSGLAVESHEVVHIQT